MTKPPPVGQRLLDRVGQCIGLRRLALRQLQQTAEDVLGLFTNSNLTALEHLTLSSTIGYQRSGFTVDTFHHVLSALSQCKTLELDLGDTDTSMVLSAVPLCAQLQQVWVRIKTKDLSDILSQTFTTIRTATPQLRVIVGMQPHLLRRDSTSAEPSRTSFPELAGIEFVGPDDTPYSFRHLF
jgi:hypothetical protein